MEGVTSFSGTVPRRAQYPAYLRERLGTKRERMVELGPSAAMTRSAVRVPVVEGLVVECQLMRRWSFPEESLAWEMAVTVRLWWWVALPWVGSGGGTAQ